VPTLCAYSAQGRYANTPENAAALLQCGLGLFAFVCMTEIVHATHATFLDFLDNYQSPKASQRIELEKTITDKTDA